VSIAFADQPGTPSLEDLERQLQSRGVHGPVMPGPLGVLSGRKYSDHTEGTVGDDQAGCEWSGASDYNLQFSQADGVKLEGILSVRNTFTRTVATRSDCGGSYAEVYTNSILLLKDGSIHIVLTDIQCLMGDCRNKYRMASSGIGKSYDGRFETLQGGAKFVLRYSDADGDVRVFTRR
jgi:hypothetical protein